MIKCLRTNDGLDFCSKDFKNFCGDNNIVSHLNVHPTLEHNGVPKRINKTLNIYVESFSIYNHFFQDSS